MPIGDNTFLVAIVGATASGKSSLAMALAERYWDGLLMLKVDVFLSVNWMMSLEYWAFAPDIIIKKRMLAKKCFIQAGLSIKIRD